MEKPTSYFDNAGLLEFMYLEHENTDLYLAHCGMQQCKPGHTFGNIARPEYHLHFVLDGQGYVEINGKRHTLNRGQIFVIPPNHSNYIYQADMHKPWYYAWIAFNGTMADYYMEQAGLNREHIIRSTNIVPEDFTGLIYEMLKTSQLTAANELDRIGYLFQIMALLIESYRTGVNSPSYDYTTTTTYIAHALQYMKFNYNSNIHVNDIANYVGINRSYFSSIFKQKMNLSPKEYLQQFRLEKAKELLADTSMSIADIALQVGYKDPFIFSKLFKKIEGLSPKAYRNQAISKPS